MTELRHSHHGCSSFLFPHLSLQHSIISAMPLTASQQQALSQLWAVTSSATDAARERDERLLRENGWDVQVRWLVNLVPSGLWSSWCLFHFPIFRPLSSKYLIWQMMPIHLLLEEMRGLRPLGIALASMTLIRTRFYRPFHRVPVDCPVQALEDQDRSRKLRWARPV